MSWYYKIKQRCRRTVASCHQVKGESRSIVLDTVEDTLRLIELLEMIQDEVELLAQKIYCAMEDGPSLEDSAGSNGLRG